MSRRLFAHGEGPRTRPIRSALRALALACALLTLDAASASATHLMGGTISWVKDSTYHDFATERIIVRFEGFFDDGSHGGFQWNPAPSIGVTIPAVYSLAVSDVFGALLQNHPLALLVVSHSLSGHWFVGVHEFELVVPKTAFPVRLEFANSDRDDELMDGNANHAQRIQSVIDLTKGTRSPRSVSLPRIFAMKSTPFTTLIPSVAYDGLSNTFRFASDVESLLLTPVPNGTPFCQPSALNSFQVPIQCRLLPPLALGSMTLSSDGFMSWQPQLAGLYALQVIVTSRDVGGNLKNSTPFDFVIEVIEPCNPATPGCNLPPVLATPTQSVTAHVNQPVSFTVTATDSANDQVTEIVHTPLPPGATVSVTPSPANGSPATATFNWTPTLAQVGSAIVCFQATDAEGGTSFGQLCVKVAVVDDPPSIACPTPISVNAAPGLFTADVPIGVTINASEFTTHTITFKVGNATFATQQITGPLAAAVRSATAAGLAIGLHQIQVSLSDGVAGASCTVNVTVKGAAQTIAFPPVPDQTFGAPDVALAATASSGLAVSYQVLSGPGTLPGGPTDPTLHFTEPGDIEVKATQGGNAFYDSAEPAIITVHVLPALCLSPDSLKAAKAGSTIPVLVAICGGTTQPGGSLEALNVTPMAGGPALPANDAGNSNPGGLFKVTGQGYKFNLKTTGLAPGVYLLKYQVVGEALVRSVPFTLR